MFYLDMLKNIIMFTSALDLKYISQQTEKDFIMQRPRREHKIDLCVLSNVIITFNERSFNHLLKR